MPSAHLGRVDPLLTGIAVGYRNPTFKADKIFPIVGEAQQTGRYPIFGKESFRRTDDTVTPESDIPVLRYDFTTALYEAAGHGHRVFCPAAPVNNVVQDPSFSDKQNATDLAMDVLHLNREYAVATAATDTGVVPTHPDAAPSTKWDQAASDIIGYVEAGKNAIRGKIGRKPNVLAIGQDVWTKLYLNIGVLERTKYTMSGVITEELMARLLGLDEIVVMDAMLDSANEGATFSGANVWPAETGLLFYRNPGLTTMTLKTPSFGKLVYWTGAPGATTGVQVRTWSDPGHGSHGGEWVAGVHYYQTLITQPEAGLILPDLLT